MYSYESNNFVMDSLVLFSRFVFLINSWYVFPAKEGYCFSFYNLMGL